MSPLVKCHPSLKHWGDDLKQSRALHDNGYKTHLFLSQHTKYRASIKRIEEKDILLFGSFRTEYTAMARYA